MNDIATREVVAWVLEKIGFKQIAKDARNESNHII